MEIKTVQRLWLAALGLFLLAVPTQAGTLVGKAVLEGSHQIVGKTTMDADQLIVAQRAVVVADKGGLANVVISIEGVPGKFSPSDQQTELDQKEKTFVPHVLPILRGQTVQFVNSDQILHNIHAHHGEATLFNTAMPFQGQRLPYTIEADGDVVLIKCDVHNNMRAWILLRENPHFGVSKESGLFSIEGVPAGTYTVRAWHEVFGSQEQTVTIKDGAEKTPMIFKFQAQ